MKAGTFDSRRFRTLQQEWPSKALVRFSLLSSENIFQVPGCRRAQNWLGSGTALFTTILVHGCNLPLTTMADVADIPYHHLTYVSDWYTRDETIHRTIIALVDYHHVLPLAAALVNSSAASTDRIRFGVSARSFHAQYRSRHFGPKRGVTVHDMTSDQYSHPCLQVIQVHLHEPHVALDEMLHYETELPVLAMMTDTHSTSSPSEEHASIARHIMRHCGSGVSSDAKRCCYSDKNGGNLLRCCKFRRRA